MKKLFKNPFFWGVIIAMISLPIYRQMALSRRHAPPPMVTVGPWELTHHKGMPFGSENLKGKVYVADFFFTRCPTICPKLTRDMQEVHKRFLDAKDQVHFVSITVDPEADTPEVLQSYREKYGIADDNWHFLTGAKKNIFDIATNQMKLGIGDKREAFGDSEEVYQINHLGELVLFDQNGDLRGKFSTDPVGLSALVRAAKFLVEKG